MYFCLNLSLTGVPETIDDSLWHPGQPNNYKGNQDHVSVYYSGAHWGLNDLNKDGEHRYICEYETIPKCK